MHTPHFHRRIASVLAIAAAIVALSGCISKPPLRKQTFIFGAPSIAAGGAGARDHVLGIRRLRITAPFDGRSLVYRTGEFSYVRDPYAEFLDPPENEMMAPVRGWLSNSGLFSDVVDAGSALKPDCIVEISVAELYGDFRSTDHPRAVVTMRLMFFNATNGVPTGSILQQEYSRSVPITATSAAALMGGWNQAIAGIFAQASSDLRRSSWNKSANAFTTDN